MFAKFHALRERDERGFTLIELLVVILIIAILAAIAIPVFLRQREKGWVSQMEAAAKNAATASESYATGQASGNYAGLSGASGITALANEGWKYSSSVVVRSVEVYDTNNKYCVIVGHASLTGVQNIGISSDQTTPTRTELATCAGYTGPQFDGAW
jgi:type IV pilus assembly protein PilA